MKQLLFLLLSFVTLSALAQPTTIKNGKIEMTIEMPSNPMMSEMSMIYLLKGDLAKMEFGAPGVFEMASYQDNAKKAVTVTMNMMGMKKGFNATIDELTADTKKTDSSDKPKVKYFDDVKEIAGYKCKKAIVTSKNPQTGDPMDATIWYCPDLIMPKINTGGGMGGNPLGNLSESITGFPMEMSMDLGQQGTMTMKTTKVDLKAEIKDDEFKVPSDYELKTYKEFKKEMGSMMGGGGD
ncbi:MAG: DUF4412 domain-containing protein [Bacteroidota bacterium]